MAHTLVCWKCGAALAALSLPLMRRDECPACRAELHVCRMCRDYDTSKAKHCREPTAEEREGAYVPAGDAAAKAKAELAKLFGC
jgi:hypothetical protein